MLEQGKDHGYLEEVKESKTPHIILVGSQSVEDNQGISSKPDSNYNVSTSILEAVNKDTEV